MQKPNVLLGITGSVATRLAPKLIAAFQEVGNVKVVMTEAATNFVNVAELQKYSGADIYLEEHEWAFSKENSIDGEWNAVNKYWQKDDPVLHIELRKWADILVIAPLTANTLAKMANGMSDNLLTSVVRAWDYTKPIVVAPAMNSEMWDNEFTHTHIEKLLYHFGEFNFGYVAPVSKKLACGDIGKGALADIGAIVERTEAKLKWLFPLVVEIDGIPVGHHPGAFGFHRKYDNHTGVDLYAPEKSGVYAVEGGKIININHFTGPQIDMPWWNDTEAVLVEGRSGVVAYCEIQPNWFFSVGDKVRRGEAIGVVKAVLPPEKKRDDIPGHLNSMLHMELYPKGINEWYAWMPDDEPKQLDPTPYLLASEFAPPALPEWDGELRCQH